ncbi:hypothetical protein Syun_019066 [Stephania yunnanensis]|uniref:non-specific serine/threonine protein kinase n=1 Tax=Stephania yunnanensis TaxID=152371 RepID=A0AAP0NWY5_9MAGN
MSPPPPPNPPQQTFSCFLCLSLLHWKRSSPPPDPSRPCRFSYSVLRRATLSFSAHTRLGQGGSGTVFRGGLPGCGDAAIKFMDSSGLQGQREFDNELLFAERTRGSDNIVKLIGFSSNSKYENKDTKERERLVLVYELMRNGSLQDALINRKFEELMDWEKRLEIAVDIAKGLEFLHFRCQPPIIHGDIKPSNVLLDGCFKAKISDFGLARVKIEKDQGNNNASTLETNRLTKDHEETESVDSNINNSSLEEKSPESFMKVLDRSVASPDLLANKKNASTQRKFDQITYQTGDSETERLKKDYVMKWVLTNNPAATTEHDNKLNKTTKVSKSGENQTATKWWREEYYESLSMKRRNKKKKQGLGLSNGSRGSDDWRQNYDHEDTEFEQQNKMKKSRSQRRGSWGSIDWWLDGFSELKRTTKWASTETTKSSFSSTHSMRGTVCYNAPETFSSGVEQISEKCDVYSYGVLLLVLISGRRPLQVSASFPDSSLERANLVSWARSLASKGRVLDLVDSNVRSLNREQAVLCIKVALLCLQRSITKRPNIKEVLDMLSGKCDAPALPSECSTSTPVRFTFKSVTKYSS